MVAGARSVSGDELPPLLRQRRDKLEALRARGIDPFGTRFPVSHWAGDLARRLDGASEDDLKAFGPAQVAGRLVSLRHHGKTCFAHLMDYTGRIQLYARADQLGEEFALFRALDVGDFVGVTGEPFRTARAADRRRPRPSRCCPSPCAPCPRSGTGCGGRGDALPPSRYVDLVVNPEIREIFACARRVVKALREFWNGGGSSKSRRR